MGADEICMYRQISQLLRKDLGAEESRAFLQVSSGSPPTPDSGFLLETRVGCSGRNSRPGKISVQWPDGAFFNELSELKYNKISNWSVLLLSFKFEHNSWNFKFLSLEGREIMGKWK